MAVNLSFCPRFLSISQQAFPSHSQSLWSGAVCLQERIKFKRSETCERSCHFCWVHLKKAIGENVLLKSCQCAEVHSDPYFLLLSCNAPGKESFLHAWSDPYLAISCRLCPDIQPWWCPRGTSDHVDGGHKHFHYEVVEWRERWKEKWDHSMTGRDGEITHCSIQ